MNVFGTGQRNPDFLVSRFLGSLWPQLLRHQQASRFPATGHAQFAPSSAQSLIHCMDGKVESRRDALGLMPPPQQAKRHPLSI